jgi:hypothetical protein
MSRRLYLLGLAFVPLLAVAACSSDSDGGSGSSGIPAKAQDIRTSLAQAYWKVNGTMPSSVDVSVGRGKFTKCSADTSDRTTYGVENMVDAKDHRTTAAQMLAELKTALAPQGWNIGLDPTQPSPTESAEMSRTTGYIAKKDGMQLQLLLQERTKTVQAGGFLDLYSSCADLGRSQKKILSQYASGNSVDVYQPTAAIPHPIPTGGPTSAP